MLGYYAHSHGSGHCNYANLFGRIFGKSITIFTDRAHVFDSDLEVVLLENEDPDGSEFDRDTYSEPRALHYAPVNISKITRRNQLLLHHIVEKNIALLIIDVSVEMAMLARVSSISYAYVRLHGDRNDLPHLNAYEGASFLLAYFPKELEPESTPPWIKKKTIYLGFLSRFMFDNGETARPKEFRNDTRPILLHISGFGGTQSVDFSSLSGSYTIYSIGPGRIQDRSSKVTHLGVVACTRAFIAHADAIVAACGSNTVAEILSLGKRFVAIPELRPYREQNHMAKILDTLGWAIDRTKYANLGDAVEALEKCKDRLPHFSLSSISAFKDRLERSGYRADKFMESHRKIHPKRKQLQQVPLRWPNY